MTLPLYYYVLGTPLGVLGLFRWGCWLVRRIPAVLYKPVLNDFRTSISIAVPVYQEDPIIFETAIQSWLANNVEEVILVIDQSDKVCQEIASRYPVTVVITDVPGKRDALVKGWNAASTELVALVDSDTIWAPDVAAEVCKPFADPRMGGVGTRQSVYGSTGLLARLTDMFLDHRYFDENASQSLLGKAVSCLSGRTAVYRRSVLMEIQEEFMNETFWGVPCLSGDDKRLTTLTLEYGYLTYMQRTAQVWSTFPDSPRVFRKQRLRWARNTWRSDLRALSRRWVWRHPFLAYTMIDKALSGFTVLLGPIFMVWALVSQNWIFCAVLALWWQISRSAKLLPHLYRRPSSFFFIPAYVVFSWVMAVIKIHALMTIRKQRWLTRQVAVENGEVVRTTGADENPAERGAAADPLTQPLGQPEPVGFGASPVALTEPVATAAGTAAAAGAPRPYPHPHPHPQPHPEQGPHPQPQPHPQQGPRPSPRPHGGSHPAPPAPQHPQPAPRPQPDPRPQPNRRAQPGVPA
jgi:cellulose synthase/poly-beta-1,6-N-acetylglucosamine synthase-like glycosyltransferase